MYSSSITQLNQRGFQLQRKGDFDGAKQAYVAALVQSPTDTALYNNVAKVCYLKGDPEAIVFSMRALHLAVNQAADQQRRSRQTLSHEKLLRTAPELLGALAHAAIDLNPRLAKSPAHQTYIARYHRSLQGHSWLRLWKNVGAVEQQAIERRYQQAGLHFALDNLCWSQLHSQNTRALYVKVTQFNFDSLRQFRFV
ncbi:MAG: hypothetical protein SF029_02150 [bacterium]|nr:hypothetical protein [bacterium]